MGRGPAEREPTTQLPLSMLLDSDFDRIIDVGAHQVFLDSDTFGYAAVAGAFGISERHLRRLIDGDRIPGHLHLTEIRHFETKELLAVLPRTHSMSAQVVLGRLIEARTARRQELARRNFG